MIFGFTIPLVLMEILTLESRMRNLGHFHICKIRPLEFIFAQLSLDVNFLTDMSY